MCVFVYEHKRRNVYIRNVYTPHKAWCRDAATSPALSQHPLPRGWVFGHTVVDIPGVSSFPLKRSVCLWHHHCAVLLPSPYTHTPLTLSAPSYVTLPIPYTDPGPSELRCWGPGWVAWEKKGPQSKLRNLNNYMTLLLSCWLIQQLHAKHPLVLVLCVRYCDRLWRIGETDPWPQGVDGLFVWVFFFPFSEKPQVW